MVTLDLHKTAHNVICFMFIVKTERSPNFEILRKQHTEDVDPMLIHCGANVKNSRPMLDHRLVFAGHTLLALMVRSAL